MLKATPIDTISSINAAQNSSVMMFGGRAYAVGLLWLTVQDESTKKLLNERIQKTKADFYCHRMHVAQQQGFGWLDKGHRRGMPVAAAMVADQLVGEWHGVFEADNGWWYVQVRSDTITPNGDRFFVSEEDAFHVFQEEAQKNIWPHSYAPEHWRLTDGHTRELSLRNLLDDLVTTSLVPTNLTAFMGSASIRNIVLAGVCLCVLVMCGVVFHAVTKEEPPPPPSARRTRPVIATPVKINPREVVSPIQLLRQCGDAADRLYIALAGWRTDKFNCASGKASMTWRQDGGRLASARDAGAKIWPENATISVKGKELTVQITLANLPKVEAQKLLTQENGLLYLEQYVQTLGSLTVKPVTPRPVRAVPQRGSAAQAAPVRQPEQPQPYLDIQVTSGYGPEDLARYLNQQGMELLNLEWRVPQGVWQYNIKWLYEVPKPVRNTNARAARNAGAGNAATGAGSSVKADAAEMTDASDKVDAVNDAGANDTSANDTSAEIKNNTVNDQAAQP